MTSFIPVNLNDISTIPFQTNLEITDSSIKEEKEFNIQIQKLIAQGSYTPAATNLVARIKNIANSSRDIFDKITSINRILKIINSDPNVKQQVINIYPTVTYLTQPPSNLLSLITTRKDNSSIDSTQWGKKVDDIPVEKSTKYGLLGKTNPSTNIKQNITDNYASLNTIMNKHQSLQLNMNIAGLNQPYDASSFSIGIETLINQNPTNEVYGFVKGLATSFNNKGDSMIHDALRYIKQFFGIIDDEYQIMELPSDNIITAIDKFLPSPLNMVYFIALYNKYVKQDSSRNNTENNCIINNNFNTDFRGTPVTLYQNLTETILIG